MFQFVQSYESRYAGRIHVLIGSGITNRRGDYLYDDVSARTPIRPEASLVGTQSSGVDSEFWTTNSVSAPRIAQTFNPLPRGRDNGDRCARRRGARDRGLDHGRGYEHGLVAAPSAPPHRTCV